MIGFAGRTMPSIMTMISGRHYSRFDYLHIIDATLISPANLRNIGADFYDIGEILIQYFISDFTADDASRSLRLPRHHAFT